TARVLCALWRWPWCGRVRHGILLKLLRTACYEQADTGRCVYSSHWPPVLGKRAIMHSLADKTPSPLRSAALAVLTPWWREMTRFVRQRSRWGSALAQPLVFWVLLGGGMQASFRPADVPVGTGYMEYFYPGVLTLVMLFTAIFATIAIVEDRREGFLQGVMV